MSLGWFHMAPGHRSTTFAQLNSFTMKCTFKRKQLVGQNQQKVVWKGGTRVSCDPVLLSCKCPPKHAGQLLRFIRGFPQACSMKVLLCNEMESSQWGLLKNHLSGGKRDPKQCNLAEPSYQLQSLGFQQNHKHSIHQNRARGLFVLAP